ANRWALGQGLQTLGSQVGAALAPPVLVMLMQAFGWQHALFWAAIPPLALIALWMGYARDTPREHPSVTRRELAELGDEVVPAAAAKISGRGFLEILVNRNILLLTFSYVCMNYVFYLIANWTFLYLIQTRHFTALEGGWLASLPPIGAAVGAGIGGMVT